MINWNIQGRRIDAATFLSMKPVDVLYDFDGPRIFTAASNDGEVLCCLVDTDDTIDRYIVAPTSQAIIERLKQGLCTVRAALAQPWVWVIDVSDDAVITDGWQCDFANIPEDVLPAARAMLWPELEPFLALRAIGPTLAEGGVPASVVRQVVDGAINSLKKVATQVFGLAGVQGRPVNAIRQLYDLPTQNFSYGSFEVAFRLPQRQQMNASLNGPQGDSEDDLRLIGRELQRVMEWVSADDHTAQAQTLPDIAMLEALEYLVPRQSGAVESIEVRGQIFEGRRESFVLTRDATRAVSHALRHLRTTTVRICRVTGVIPEVDKDNLTFTLRETDDGSDHSCVFPSTLLDEVLLAFNVDKRVTVHGSEDIRNGQIEVLSLQLN